MIDLSSRYLGLTLKNPLVASASPLTGKLDRALELEDAGVSAIVCPSLFEEQIEHDEMESARLGDLGTDSFGEALDYFPTVAEFRAGPDEHLEHVRKLKDRAGIPIIASLNGTTLGGWIRYARLFQEAGADALELNIYDVPTDGSLTGGDVEQGYVDLVVGVREAIDIPLAVKIGPYFSSLVHMADRFREAGADGLVLFNRFMQPDIDLDIDRVVPNVQLSSPHEIRLPLRWIAILRGRVELSLAATSGVHYADDVVKLLMAGADVTMMTSAILKHGTGWPKMVLEVLTEWLKVREYESVEQLKGAMSHANCPNPEGFERANYMRALVTYTPRV